MLYRQPGTMLMLWSHKRLAPWQTDEWDAQMQAQLRPNAYLRMIRNTFVTSESTFVDPAWWAACEDASAHPVVADPTLAVYVGLDASTKRDQTAVVAVTWDEAAKKVRLVWHRVFQPSATDPLDFEATVEETVLGLKARFNVREVRFDPWQMQAVSQRLQKAGVPMVEFPQSVPNLTEASTNLYELIKGSNLLVYRDDALRLAVHRAVALESSRGWRIAKEKASHKIDVVVALAMAALGAVKQPREDGFYGYLRMEAEARAHGEDSVATAPQAGPNAPPSVWAGRPVMLAPLTLEERRAAYGRLEDKVRRGGRWW